MFNGISSLELISPQGAKRTKILEERAYLFLGSYDDLHLFINWSDLTERLG